MKIKIAILLLGVLLVFCFASVSSCKKEEASSGCQPDSDINYISEAMKSYFFDVGSYWIYSNDSTGTFDTITVTGIADTLIYLPQPTTIFHGGYAQYFRCQFKRASTEKVYFELCRQTSIYRSEEFTTNYGQGVFTYTNDTFDNMVYACTGVYASFFLNAVTYNEVRRFWAKGNVNNNSCSPLDIETWYSPNIGLIKFTETETSGYVHSYSLVDKSIARYELIQHCDQ